MMGLHRRITLSFMITGYTRCLVDRCFGVLQKKFRSSDCYSLPQLAQLVNESSSTNIAQLFQGAAIQYHKWDEFFATHFKAIKGIRSVHHMVFDASKPGIVLVKETLNGQLREVDILISTKEALLQAGLPGVIIPGGMSHERVKYLFYHVRQHVPEEYQDVLCPMPNPH